MHNHLSGSLNDNVFSFLMHLLKYSIKCYYLYMNLQKFFVFSQKARKLLVCKNPHFWPFSVIDVPLSRVLSWPHFSWWYGRFPIHIYIICSTYHVYVYLFGEKNLLSFFIPISGISTVPEAESSLFSFKGKLF